MEYDLLLAKGDDGGRRPWRRRTIREHTLAVMRAAERLADVTGDAQLSALGLDSVHWAARFRRDLLLASLLHDLGKANDHFQEMVRGQTPRRQGLRHESVSFLIARLPEIRAWVAPVTHGRVPAELIVWAVSGHHRKFCPPLEPEEDGRPHMTVYLGHPGFRETLALGTAELGLAEPPRFAGDLELTLTRVGGSLRAFDDAADEAEEIMESLPRDERAYLAALKACLIGADVAGSIERRGVRTMVDWIPEAFARVPTVEQLEGVVAAGLKGGELRPFQAAVAERTERVVFVRAGCGSGKTTAAYLWAARRAPGRRLFFCYPTTGTATEGYRDYLADPALDAELVHGRADVDLEILGLGDDEPGRVTSAGEIAGRAAADSAGALEQWATPLVGCTVDTVLGLMQNNRRGIYAWPSLAGAAFVFDEIHAYDDRLFAALLRFLVEVRGVPSLLMTASLPEGRLEALRRDLGAIGEPLGGPVDGPQDLEELPRYARAGGPDPWRLVEEAHARGGKVLWVVNTVGAAMGLAADRRAMRLGALLYHSRFRYRDRVVRHRDVIEAFRTPGLPALAIATQVAEMSLDLSADLLLTHLAPIPALIQRLGRLNRRARPGSGDGVKPFVVLEPEGPLPYAEEDLGTARAWLGRLGDGELSQADLARGWGGGPTPGRPRREPCAWVDGGIVTEPRPLRQSSPGIDVILEADAEALRSGAIRLPEAVRIPMPEPPGRDWREWDEVAFCKVPPARRIAYDPRRGAEWTA